MVLPEALPPQIPMTKGSISCDPWASYLHKVQLVLDFWLYRPGWQFNWLKFSLEKPLEFWLEFPLDSTEDKGPF